MIEDETICISTYEYAVEFGDGWVYLTRYLSECIDCPHRDVCKEWTVDYTHSDCNYVALTSDGCELSDTYDFNSTIDQHGYPEFNADEIAIINSIISGHCAVN